MLNFLVKFDTVKVSSLTVFFMQSTQLQRLLDKQEILELSHRYCRAADRHDYAELAKLYHEDAIEDHGSFFNGLAKDFLKQMPAIQESMQILHHNITTANIFFDDDKPNIAEGEIYVLAFHQVKTETDLIDLLVGGRYLDKYEKRDDQWRFSFRTIVADWANLHDPSLVNMQNPMVSGSHQGSPSSDDPSFRFLNLV